MHAHATSIDADGCGASMRTTWVVVPRMVYPCGFQQALLLRGGVDGFGRHRQQTRQFVCDILAREKRPNLCHGYHEG